MLENSKEYREGWIAAMNGWYFWDEVECCPYFPHHNRIIKMARDCELSESFWAWYRGNRDFNDCVFASHCFKGWSYE